MEVPLLEPRAWEVPPAWAWRAANSLYRLDATVDEGAAGRPEVQEGQAGRSGQSGLATGTENRREMNRVKRKKDSSYSNGEGQRREKSWVSGEVRPQGTPTLCMGRGTGS